LRYKIEIEVDKFGRKYKISVLNKNKIKYKLEIYNYELDHFYHSFGTIKSVFDEIILTQCTAEKRVLALMEIKHKEDAKELVAIFTAALKSIREIEPKFKNMSEVVEENLNDCGCWTAEI